MGWWSTGVQVVGLGADLYSSYKGSEAAEDNAEAQAAEYKATAEANAVISRYDANVERLQAIEQSYVTNQTVAAHRKKIEKMVGTQTARYSKSGVVTSTGTPLEVAVDTIKTGSMDEYTIRNEGRKASQIHSLLSERYEMLAQKGLREASSLASLAIQAGNDASDAYLLKGIGTASEKVYSIGSDLGWFPS